MKKIIYFDMDGTIADLYGIEDWLPRLRSADPSPYIEAKPLLRLSDLARALHKLQALGFKIGVISWGSLGASADYDIAVEKAKREWLKKHLASVDFDEITISPYGIPKSTLASEIGILFDDNEKIRQEWENNGGIAYDVDNILEILRNLRQG